MEIFLIKALQLILCFALLIVLHEAGHFLFAKLFKVRVEKFCLFFDPWKSWKLFSWRGTDYHIGWIPLGGYVKISGMIDESMDTEQMKQPVKPWEFRAKPAWQRLLIMVGGVMVNFLLAFFIYAMVLFAWGDTYTPIERMSQGFKFNESAQSLGFRDGDIPLRADGQRFTRFSANLFRDLSQARSATVLRQGKEATIALPGNLNLLEMLQAQPPFAAPLSASLVDSVFRGGPAEKAGIRRGDHLLAIGSHVERIQLPSLRPPVVHRSQPRPGRHRKSASAQARHSRRSTPQRHASRHPEPHAQRRKPHGHIPTQRPRRLPHSHALLHLL